MFWNIRSVTFISSATKNNNNNVSQWKKQLPPGLFPTGSHYICKTMFFCLASGHFTSRNWNSHTTAPFYCWRDSSVDLLYCSLVDRKRFPFPSNLHREQQSAIVPHLCFSFLFLALTIWFEQTGQSRLGTTATCHVPLVSVSLHRRVTAEILTSDVKIEDKGNKNVTTDDTNEMKRITENDKEKTINYYFDTTVKL